MKKKIAVILLLMPVVAMAAEQAAPEQSTTLLQQLLEIFSSGGILMWMILACSVAGLSFTLERLVALRRKVHLPEDLVEQTCRMLEREGAAKTKNFLQKQNGTLARSLLGVMGSVGHREAMRRELEEELSRALCDERRNIRPVGICASVSPLLGLLGTVTGLIEAFRRAAASGMDNPQLFAGGIYQALYTTAFGLMVAIPCLLAAHLLKGRLELILRQSEDQALKYIDTICEYCQEQEPETDGGISERAAA